MSEGLKSKLARLEAKIQPNNDVDYRAENTLELAYAEYLYKHLRMTLTPEELKKAYEDSANFILEWYIAYLKQSPEEQKISFEPLTVEGAKNKEEFKVWRDSPERVKFDEEYAKRFGFGSGVNE
jgi:hypothetical protein